MQEGMRQNSEGDKVMKCDELQYERLGDANKTYPASTLVIRKQFVDEAIAELKSENERLNRELEHVKNGDCINTCDVVEKHVKEEIKAKRALWLARANRAMAEIYSVLNDVLTSNRWVKALNKLKAKAEEYNG